ncbi:MAG: hypothetical protein JKY71_08470 [Alphaproteobacteria bacterium]|nr:hypothetical protein [Alphaproteobacteria bacterium]
MNTFAQPTSGDTDPANEAIRNFHFNLAQIREIGLDHGVSEGVLARRMKDLTDTERELLRSRYSDEVMRMLAQKSYELGKDIIIYADKIDDMADAIDDAIKDLEGLEPAEQHQERLKDLKEDKGELVKHRQSLERIERNRVNATPETIQHVETEFTEFQTRFDTFEDSFRNRSYSNMFDMGAISRGARDRQDQPTRRQTFDYDETLVYNKPSADADAA